jgi:GT2 family glycosyltransferase
MFRFWDFLTRPLLEAIDAQQIVEIGSDEGWQTERLLSWASERGSTVHVVDPLPKYDVAEWKKRWGAAYEPHLALSLNALGPIGSADAVLIDGDHNWYTVFHELEVIARFPGSLPLVILHDVGWPYGRRDMYYDPETVPAGFRQAYQRKGLVLGKAELVADGGINHHLFNSVYEGTPRNGVLTAVEDFVEAHESAVALHVHPGLHGCALLVNEELRGNAAVAAVLADLDYSERTRALIQAVEADRLLSMERVSKLRADVALLNERMTQTGRLHEDAAALAADLDAANAEREVLAGLLAEQRSAVAVVTQERDQARQDHDRTKAELREAQAAANAARSRLKRLQARRSVRAALRVAHWAEPAITLTMRSQAAILPQRKIAKPAAPLATERRTATADIVICVHNAPEDVRRCFDSLVRTTNLVLHNVIVIDDGSDPETADVVDAFVANTGATLQRHQTAQGYTRAANAGLQLSRADYVVLLNSDTIVTQGWLDRLLACAAARPDAAVIGPWSNAASWQSIPRLTDENGRWLVNDEPPGGMTSFSQTLALRSTLIYPRVPAVNGFCYLITRRALDAVGLLDAESFPRGYGEEDDFSLRATAAGFSLYLADDAYIFHAKSRSFTPAGRDAIVIESKKALQNKHGSARLKKLARELRTERELVRARTYASLLAEEEVSAAMTPQLAGLRVAWLQPHLKVVGGIRRAIEMSNRLARWGADVHLVTPNGTATGWLAIEATVTTIERASAEEYDVVIVSDPDMMQSLGQMTRARSIVYHLAGYALYRDHSDGLEQFYALTDATHIANSKWTADVAAGANSALTIAGIVPGGIDRTLFRPLAAPVEFEVGCYGSRRPHKGTDTIEAAAAGRSLLKLDGMNLQQRELARHIARCAVFASGCWHEGFNFVPLEAMACGVPVAMTDDGGSREYARNGENALVVQPHDTDGLRAAIATLHDDPLLAANLIENGMRTAWQYDWDAMTIRFASLAGWLDDTTTPPSPLVTPHDLPEDAAAPTPRHQPGAER